LTPSIFGFDFLSIWSIVLIGNGASILLSHKNLANCFETCFAFQADSSLTQVLKFIGDDGPTIHSTREGFDQRKTSGSINSRYCQGDYTFNPTTEKYGNSHPTN
jgi:hypothetical protein